MYNIEDKKTLKRIGTVKLKMEIINRYLSVIHEKEDSISPLCNSLARQKKAKNF
jgi:hypothetical protein